MVANAVWITVSRMLAEEVELALLTSSSCEEAIAAARRLKSAQHHVFKQTNGVVRE